jgi:hypothetical protein
VTVAEALLELIVLLRATGHSLKRGLLPQERRPAEAGRALCPAPRSVNMTSEVWVASDPPGMGPGGSALDIN